jgi:hypothetical protein
MGTAVLTAANSSPDTVTNRVTSTKATLGWQAVANKPTSKPTNKLTKYFLFICTPIKNVKFSSAWPTHANYITNPIGIVYRVGYQTGNGRLDWVKQRIKYASGRWQVAG